MDRVVAMALVCMSGAAFVGACATGTNSGIPAHDDGAGDADSDADGGDADADADSDTDVDADADSDADTDTDTGPDERCPETSLESICHDDASVIMGYARAPEGAKQTKGTLIVTLTHRALGEGATGGVGHTGIQVLNADISGKGQFFELDMCEGGAMWSEENCAFNVTVRLDVDNDDEYVFLPDSDEPAKQVVIDLSCHSRYPTCLGDVVLDCLDGASCAQFDDTQGCTCSAESCPSASSSCTDEKD